MHTTEIGYTYWQDETVWLGYLDDYPDYRTQGATLAELEENLLDIHHDLTHGYIPAVRQRGALKLT